MTLINFKLVTIICEPVVKTKIIELSQNLGATGFTITEVSGQGNGEKSSGEIPDAKSKIEVVADSALATKIMTKIAETFFENYSLITYSSDISIMRPQKFEK